MAERKINMSIAQTVKDIINHTNYYNCSAEAACFYDTDTVKAYNGVLLREASAEDGIRSTFLTPKTTWQIPKIRIAISFQNRFGFSLSFQYLLLRW